MESGDHRQREACINMLHILMTEAVLCMVTSVITFQTYYNIIYMICMIIYMICIITCIIIIYVLLLLLYDIDLASLYYYYLLQNISNSFVSKNSLFVDLKRRLTLLIATYFSKKHYGIRRLAVS